MTGGVRVGRPAPAALVASYFLAALLAWPLGRRSRSWPRRRN